MKAFLSSVKKLKAWHLLSAALTVIAIVAALTTATATLSACSCLEFDSDGHCID